MTLRKKFYLSILIFLIILPDYFYSLLGDVSYKFIYISNAWVIQANKPEEKSGYHIIKAVEIDSDICKQNILLNPNLNTIIGGRSTGKSTQKFYLSILIFLIILPDYFYSLLGDVSYKFIYISNAWVNSVSNR
jgi:hypothetical protein